MCGIVGYVGHRPGGRFFARKGCAGWNIAATTAPASCTITPEGRFALGQDRPAGSTCWKPSWPTHQRRARSASATPAGPRTAPPTDANAHPHLGGDRSVAIVHNGVIENFRPLKERLEAEGYHFHSATDTEVIAHLIASCLESDNRRQRTPHAGGRRTIAPTATTSRWSDAVSAALAQLQGTYGLAILFRDYPDVMIAARHGSPLVVGVGDGEHFFASDASPLAGHTDQIVYLADHELAVLTADSLRVIASRAGPRRPRRAGARHW